MNLRDALLEELALIDLDNAPTPERQTHTQFSVRNNIWRVRTIAERLHASHKITSDVYNSAQRWTSTYVILRDGPGAIQAGTSNSIVKHDAISFVMDQALRADSIPEIRDFIGKGNHALLVMTLYECYSSSALASIIGGERPRKTLSDSIDRMCISAYKKLNDFYVRNRLTKDA